MLRRIIPLVLALAGLAHGQTEKLDAEASWSRKTREGEHALEIRRNGTALATRKSASGSVTLRFSGALTADELKRFGALEEGLELLPLATGTFDSTKKLDITFVRHSREHYFQADTPAASRLGALGCELGSKESCKRNDAVWDFSALAEAVSARLSKGAETPERFHELTYGSAEGSLSIDETGNGTITPSRGSKVPVDLTAEVADLQALFKAANAASLPAKLGTENPPEHAIFALRARWRGADADASAEAAYDGDLPPRPGSGAPGELFSPAGRPAAPLIARLDALCHSLAERAKPIEERRGLEEEIAKKEAEIARDQSALAALRARLAKIPAPSSGGILHGLAAAEHER
jgi:hypothetical protein